jgi:hypothetical protein
VAALIDNLRMSYLLQIDEFVAVYKELIMATQSHYNALLHLASKTVPSEEIGSACSVEVVIEEKPAEIHLSELHL